VLGYSEDVVGCKAYFPEERTAKYVPELRVAEEVVYRDRNTVDVDDLDLASLYFTRYAVCTGTDSSSANAEMATQALGSEMAEEGELDESEDMQSVDLEEGELAEIERPTSSERCPGDLRQRGPEWDIVPESDISDESLTSSDQRDDTEVVEGQSRNEAKTATHKPHDDEREEGVRTSGGGVGI
jgi:hypothetical protein